MYSCGGSECKELLACLSGREVAQALNDPALVVTLAKFRQRAARFLDVLEHPDPQQLLFQRANEPSDAAVAFRLARDLSGEQLARLLRQYSYEVTRQTGSHLRLTTKIRATEHHVTIPAHSPLKIGTLSAILAEVAAYLEMDRAKLASELFGR